jgi:[histone H3]-trimethyl-L-lysine4 demethylase
LHSSHLLVMHGVPSSSTPRGTPSRRGRSPRFFSDSPGHADSGPSSNALSNKAGATFTSSLSILVEGATRIEADISPASTAISTVEVPQSATTSDSKRAPRKSKTDALVALHTHARSSSIGPEDSTFRDADDGAYANSRPPIPVSPILDMSSVKTSSPRLLHSRTNPRPFDLEDCPVFYPTTEEFKDPMTYIRSISGRAKMFGLCKIVPPVEWKMSFVTDTEVGTPLDLDSCLKAEIFSEFSF